jgi:hypothetical protein
VTVTDNDGATAKATATVKVNAQPVANKPPKVTVASKTITVGSPVTLTATASDEDGNITKYQWINKLTNKIVGSNSEKLELTNLTAGTHTFEVTVTDNDGATTKATATVKVNAQPVANKPPKVTVISKTITVGSPVTLTAAASDEDGDITKYQWVNKSTNQTEGSAKELKLTNLTVGTHTFEVTVTDNDGATAKATATVKVNAKPIENKPPRVTIVVQPIVAGQTATLTAYAFDDDGNISSYKWINSLTNEVENSTTDKLMVSNLTVGTHAFKVIVTDDKGATAEATANVIVTVAPVDYHVNIDSVTSCRTVTNPIDQQDLYLIAQYVLNSTQFSGAKGTGIVTTTGFTDNTCTTEKALPSYIPSPLDVTYTITNINNGTGTMTIVPASTNPFATTATQNVNIDSANNVTFPD